jgi:hypothetical protein
MERLMLIAKPMKNRPSGLGYQSIWFFLKR